MGLEFDTVGQIDEADVGDGGDVDDMLFVDEHPATAVKVYF